jgi:hypothetical protein
MLISRTGVGGLPAALRMPALRCTAGIGGLALLPLQPTKGSMVKTALTVATLCELIESCEGQECQTHKPSWSLRGDT